MMMILGAWEGDVRISPVKRTRAMMIGFIMDYIREENPDVIYDRWLLKEFEDYYPGYKSPTEIIDDHVRDRMTYLNRIRKERKEAMTASDLHEKDKLVERSLPFAHKGPADDTIHTLKNWDKIFSTPTGPATFLTRGNEYPERHNGLLVRLIQRGVITVSEYYKCLKK